MASYSIQLKRANEPEYFVALALEMLGKEYIFQYPIMGGRSLRGGVVVDFVVQDPFARGLEVFGEHWHRAQLTGEERFRLSKIEQYFGRPPVIIWARDLESVDLAYKYLKKELGRLV